MYEWTLDAMYSGPRSLVTRTSLMFCFIWILLGKLIHTNCKVNCKSKMQGQKNTSFFLLANRFIVHWLNAHVEMKRKVHAFFIQLHLVDWSANNARRKTSQVPCTPLIPSNRAKIKTSGKKKTLADKSLIILAWSIATYFYFFVCILIALRARQNAAHLVKNYSYIFALWWWIARFTTSCRYNDTQHRDASYIIHQLSYRTNELAFVRSFACSLTRTRLKRTALQSRL